MKVWSMSARLIKELRAEVDRLKARLERVAKARDWKMALADELKDRAETAEAIVDTEAQWILDRAGVLAPLYARIALLERENGELEKDRQHEVKQKMECIDELAQLRAVAHATTAALIEMVERGGRLVHNDMRSYIVVPHEESLAQAKAAIDKAKAAGWQEGGE